MPGDLGKALVEVGKERTEVLVSDKAAEKALVIRIAQLLAQRAHKRLAAGVALDRVLRVIRDPGDHRHYAAAGRQIVGEQHDAGQSGGQDTQLIPQQRLATVSAVGLAIEQADNAVIATLRQVLLEQGHVQRAFQGAHVAVLETLPQAGLGHGVIQVKVVAQVALIRRADVELAAQRRELRDCDLRGHPRQRFKVPDGRGSGAEGGGAVIGIDCGFAGFKVVQRRLDQRHRPGAGGAGFDGETGDFQRDIKLQPGAPHVDAHAVLRLERRLQVLGAKSLGAFELRHGSVHRVLGNPGLVIEALERSMLRRAGIFVPVGDDRFGLGQVAASVGCDVGQPWGQGVFQDVVVGNGGGGEFSHKGSRARSRSPQQTSSRRAACGSRLGLREICRWAVIEPAHGAGARFKLRHCDAICRIAVNPRKTGVGAIRSCRLAARSR